jgi:predicted anti-sigma-YlaC factor YlaD
MVLSRLFSIFGKGEADCPEVRAASSDYIDEDLGERQRARIDSHLEKCPLCRAFINTMLATVNLLKSAFESEPPEGFQQRVKERIAEEGKPGG